MQDYCDSDRNSPQRRALPLPSPPLHDLNNNVWGPKLFALGAYGKALAWA